MTPQRNIAVVVGARPNLVKIAPILDALRGRDGIRPLLVHTGQHYDDAMSQVFFVQLGIPAPDVHLAVGSGTQGAQTAAILSRFEDWLVQTSPRPAATLVVGDVNSTMACALASVKLGVPVVHVEAGLRSFDRTMPEEINRVVTDAIAALHLVSEPSGMDNLRREGHADASLRLVGNVMIDTLHRHRRAALELDQPSRLGLGGDDFAIWTMHRPGNVDDPESLARFVRSLRAIAARIPVVFPVHPRTRARLEAIGAWSELAATPGTHLCSALGYLELLGLLLRARIVITDSGGLQEESTAIGVPCLTLRPNTERPITVTEGTSTLIGGDMELLEHLVDDVLAGRYKTGRCPTLWDGHAGERVAHRLVEFIA